MNPLIADLFRYVLYALIILIVVRSLLSWFPISPRNQYVQLVYRVTEPLLAPFRRVIPPLGMFDISSMVVIVLLYVMVQVVKSVAAR